MISFLADLSVFRYHYYYYRCYQTIKLTGCYCKKTSLYILWASFKQILSCVIISSHMYFYASGFWCFDSLGRTITGFVYHSINWFSWRNVHQTSYVYIYFTIQPWRKLCYFWGLVSTTYPNHVWGFRRIKWDYTQPVVMNRHHLLWT